MNFERKINHRCRIIRYVSPEHYFSLEYRLIGKRFNKWKEVARIHERFWNDELQTQLFDIRNSKKKLKQQDMKF